MPLHAATGVLSLPTSGKAVPLMVACLPRGTTRACCCCCFCSCFKHHNLTHQNALLLYVRLMQIDRSRHTAPGPIQNGVKVFGRALKRQVRGVGCLLNNCCARHTCVNAVLCQGLWIQRNLALCLAHQLQQGKFLMLRGIWGHGGIHAILTSFAWPGAFRLALDVQCLAHTTRLYS